MEFDGGSVIKEYFTKFLIYFFFENVGDQIIIFIHCSINYNLPNFSKVNKFVQRF